MAQVCFLNRKRPNWLWTFSFMVLAGVCVVGLAGCGSGGGGAGLSARATCQAQGLPDYSIDSLFTVVRIDRDAGFSASQELQAIRESCRVGDGFGGGCINNPNVGISITYEECVAACMSCASAVVGEVYGIR